MCRSIACFLHGRWLCCNLTATSSKGQRCSKRFCDLLRCSYCLLARHPQMVVKTCGSLTTARGCFFSQSGDRFYLAVHTCLQRRLRVCAFPWSCSAWTPSWQVKRPCLHTARFEVPRKLQVHENTRCGCLCCEGYLDVPASHVATMQ